MLGSNHFKLYKILNTKEALFVRGVLFMLVFVIGILFFDNVRILLILSPFLFVLILQELFIKKLRTLNPARTVTNAENLYEATLFNVRADMLSPQTSHELVVQIARTKEGRFAIQKINSSLQLVDINLSKDELLKKAGELVQMIQGKYIHAVDVLVAYILLQEPSVKILEQEGLMAQDMLVILFWVRKRFRIEDPTEVLQGTFNGSGIFDQLIHGWTPATKKYTSDFTSEVIRLGYEPKAVGREKEYRQMIESLSRGSSSNVLLIGNPGVGKTTLVMDVAYDAHKGEITKNLKRKRIYFLFIDRLISGAKDRGEIERRLNNIFTEVSHAGNVIVFLESIENIFGGGGFNFDISGALEPYLESSRVQIIGTTTPQAYKDFIAPKSSVQIHFHAISLDEPDEKTTLFMAIHDIEIREKSSNVIVTYGAVREIINSANLYSSNLLLPGSAIRLLEDTIVRVFHAGRNTITAADVQELIVEKTGVNLSAPTVEEKKKLLNLEDTLHKRLVGQNEAVSAVSNAVRRLRSGLKKSQGPIASFLFLGPSGVGKTTMAKLLSKEYFGDEKKMIRVDMSEYQTEESMKKLLGEMPGEQSFSESLIDKIVKNPFSVVLLDEFEKANTRLLDVFLQILDEGFVTNNKGKKVSFSNAIIIATSNAGSEFIRQKIATGEENIKTELIEFVLTKEIFRPELINRFSDVVVFHPLAKEHVIKIADLMLMDLKEKLLQQSIDISFSESSIAKISREAFDADFGARNVRRYIEEHIENLISRGILEETIRKGEKIFVTLDHDNNYILEK